MNNLFLSLIFVVEMLFAQDCKQTNIDITIPAHTAYTYQIGNAKEFSDTFPVTYLTTLTSNSCSENYDITIDSTEPVGLNSGWINKKNDFVEWQTNDPQRVGVYVITIKVVTNSLNDATASQTFTLTALGVECLDSSQGLDVKKGSGRQDVLYTVGSTTDSTATINPFTETKNDWCDESDIIYSLSVTPQTVGQDTSFFQVDPQSGTVSFLTYQNQNAGTFTVIVTGTITKNDGVSDSDFTDFKVTIITLSCAASSDMITVIGATISDQTYMLKGPSISLQISAFTHNSLFCDETDFSYQMVVSPSAPFINFNQATRTVTWSTNDANKIGSYTVTVSGYLSNGAGTHQGSSIFLLDVVAIPCAMSTDSVSINIGGSVATKVYSVGDTLGSTSIAEFQVNSDWCVSSDIVYEMTVVAQGAQDTSFIMFDPATRTVSWQTQDVSLSGYYTIVVTGQITRDDLSVAQDQVSFLLQVGASCSVSAETIIITASLTTDASYLLTDPAGSQVISFTEDSTLCQPADIVKTMTVTPTIAGQSTAFIEYNTQTDTVSWYSTDAANIGEFQISVIGTIQAVSTFTQETSFILTVTPVCYQSIDPITITVSTTPLDQAYRVNDGIGSLTIAQFKQKSLFCYVTDISYSMTVQSLKDNSFISFDPLTRTIQWKSETVDSVGPYTITISGVINRLDGTQALATTSFTLFVEVSCADSSELLALVSDFDKIDQITYYVGATQQASIQIPMLIAYDEVYCSSESVVYEMEDIDESFITFDGQSRIVNWMTQDNQFAGLYDISIRARAADLITSYQFTLKILLDKVTIVTNQELTVYETVEGQPGNITINEFEETTSNVYSTQDIEYSIQASAKFFTFNPKTLEISWKNSTLGNYTITVVGTVAQQSASVFLQVKVTPQPVAVVNEFQLVYEEAQQVTNVDLEKTRAKIKSISADGLVSVTFLGELYVPDLFEANSIQVKVIPGFYSDPTQLGFTYNVTLYSQTGLELQIEFDDPNQVSRDISTPDILQITLLKPYFFARALQERTETKGDIVLTKRLPRVYRDSYMESFTEAANALSATTKAAVAGGFAMNFLLALSLQQLWSLIETQQLIVLMPLFNTGLPENAKMVFDFIFQIAAFDLISTDEFYENNFEMGESEALSQNFEALGFESVNFLSNIGSLVFGILAIPVLFLLLGAMKLLQMAGVLKKVYSKFSKYMFWSQPIGFLQETCMMVTICSLINLYKGTNDTSFDRANTVISGILLIVLIAASASLMVILCVNYTKLKEKPFQDRLGSLYESLKLKDKTVLLNTVYYFVRRITFPMVVILTDKLCYQVMLSQLQYIVAVIILGVKPFEDPKKQKLEIFNEVVMLLILMCMIGFSDLVPTLEGQFVVGYVCSIIIVLHLAVNIVLIGSVSIKGLIMHIKRCRYRQIQAKKRKIAQEEQNKKKVVNPRYFDVDSLSCEVDQSKKQANLKENDTEKIPEQKSPNLLQISQSDQQSSQSLQSSAQSQELSLIQEEQKRSVSSYLESSSLSSISAHTDNIEDQQNRIQRIIQKSSKTLIVQEAHYYKPSSKTLNFLKQQTNQPQGNLRRKRLIKQSSKNLTNLLSSILDNNQQQAAAVPEVRRRATDELLNELSSTQPTQAAKFISQHQQWRSSSHQLSQLLENKPISNELFIQQIQRENRRMTHDRHQFSKQAPKILVHYK